MGDVMLGRLVNERLRVAEPASVWGDVLALLAGADARIANLECVLADDGTPWPGKVFHFRSDPAHVASLVAAGIDIVTLANNHTLDYGRGALAEMLAVLDAHAILHAGAGPDADAARRPAVLRVGRTGLAVLAVTDNEPGWAAAERTPGVFHVPADLRDPRAESLLGLVWAARRDAGFLIVSAHWGPNWGEDVPEEHAALAHALVDAGADLVFGHSPHVVRGVEVYRGRPILYAAGDFVDDYAVDPVERNDRGFLFIVHVHEGAPAAVRLYPTVIEDRRVRRARFAEEGVIAARMARLCAALGTTARWLDAERCLEIRTADDAAR